MMTDQIKKRLITISTTLGLLMVAAIIHFLHENRALVESPMIPIAMLVCTAIYVFGSCMLQTFGKLNLSLSLGVVAFFFLCTCLFYSVSILDFIVFFACMSLLVKKSTKTCECFKDCKNPLR